MSVSFLIIVLSHLIQELEYLHGTDAEDVSNVVRMPTLIHIDAVDAATMEEF